VKPSLLRFASSLLVVSLAVPASAASRLPVRARNGMVVTQSEEATRVGLAVLQKGGNAIDAAVAVAFALAVTWPTAGNIGGGGFMVIRRADGRIEALDYRERAPLAAHRDMYLDASGNVVFEASTYGYKAVAVPGTVAGLALARERHGTLPWRELVEPARRLAADGFTVTPWLALNLRDPDNVQRLERDPESRRIFLGNGRAPAEWDTFRQPDLARTLERLRDRGPREFYEGETARLLVAAMKANGGLVTEKDLREYEPTVREPLRGTYRGLEIVTMPPPSSGGIALLEMLNMLERHEVGKAGAGSAAATHLLIETMKRAFADRASHLGDTDFVSGVPVSTLTSKDYAAKLGGTFDPARATPASEVRPLGAEVVEPVHTTHFTVADKDGNVVTSTTTLNENYGSGVTVPGAGFVLNNEMDDFTSKPGVPNLYGLLQSEKNAIAPRKRPLSSMTPTIVMREDRPWLALGSPGGPTIITAVLQVIVNVVDHGMQLQEAVDAPRVHHQWAPDEVRVEPRLNLDTSAKLLALGHRYSDNTERLGDVHAVMIQDGVLHGAPDPRSGGVALGY
jgi:gamma-glutamyltranspeptidase/glutathione hydrolase